MRIAAGAVLIAAVVTGSGLRLGAPAEERTSTLADQTRINVSIYNAGLALTSSVRVRY